MIVYNVSLSIHPERETEVLEWLKATHIPEVLDTGLFLQAEMFRVMERPGAAHNSYAIQYRLSSWGDFERYQNEHAPALQQKTRELFGENVLAFRTFLEKEWEMGQAEGGQQ